MKILSCLVSIALVAQPLLAQDAECFIEDSKGRKVDLGEICGKKKPPVALPSSPRPQFVSIPIKNRRGNTPVIEVTFNGDQTFDMILDTGATGTVITQQMANKLKVKPFTSIKAQVADGSVVLFPIGFVESIGVNGATVNRLPVAIAPQIQLGLLGNDFLNSYDVKIKRDTIELYQRN
jgi:aspartyl protease family protein